MQDEIQFLARAAAWIRIKAFGVRAAQARGLGEQIELMIAPVGIEIAGDDDGFGRLAHQIVEIAKLILPVPELQRQMHQKNRDVVELQLDDEPFDARVEVMKALAADARSCEE